MQKQYDYAFALVYKTMRHGCEYENGKELLMYRSRRNRPPTPLLLTVPHKEKKAKKKTKQVTDMASAYTSKHLTKHPALCQVFFSQ